MGEKPIIREYGVAWIIVHMPGRYRVYSGPRWYMSGSKADTQRVTAGVPDWYARIEQLVPSGWQPRTPNEIKIQQKYPLIAQYYRVQRRWCEPDQYWLCGNLFSMAEILGGGTMLDTFEENIRARLAK